MLHKGLEGLESKSSERTERDRVSRPNFFFYIFTEYFGQLIESLYLYRIYEYN